MRRLLPLVFVVLAACEAVPTTVSRPQVPTDAEARPVQVQAARAAKQFVQVVETVEPVAEQECRRRAPRMNCDFQIVVDDRPDQPPNAFQTVDRRGRPILAFNIALIASVKNADELAFVMGHEAAHHIQNHLAKTQESAIAGAVILSGIAALGGGDAAAVKQAEEFGAALGARTFSKDFELEADHLGTFIAARAGYNPVKGAQFFNRIPDPGNRFLGTHPPNAARMQTVRDAAAQLNSG
jgi:predicted Zn-dependent protease